eukprot:Em0004g56a
MGSDASVLRSDGTMDVKNKSRLAEDVKKITFAASKLKISTKRRDKPQKSQRTESIAEPKQPVDTREEVRPHIATNPVVDRSSVESPAEAVVRAAPARAEKKWTLTDLLHCLGTYVQEQCSDLDSPPTPNDIAMWVRCADRALQLNGWTINSFLMESHIVFTYLLLTQAFERFTLKTLVDVKEVVLMCLYVSYTYNANEISYPLRPFLVKQDKSTFWDKCTTLSLGASTQMLKLNRESTYYADVLATLKTAVSV